MNISNDPYDTGSPLYQSAQDIYDALYKLTETEEMRLLFEMFGDVSDESRGYYYTDTGINLKEEFEQLSDYGDKMWLMDLAMWQMDEESDVNDLVYNALFIPDFAKCIGLKRIFINELLQGEKSQYDKFSEAFCEELGELSRFSFYENMKAFNRVLYAHGIPVVNSYYSNFTEALYKKVRNIDLRKEMQLLIECRSLLTSYDDFMLGLRMNKALFDRLDHEFKMKEALLKESFDEKVKQLFEIAESRGLLTDFTSAMPLLELRSVEVVEADNE